MAPEEHEKRPEKSYLTSAVDSINPWSAKRGPSPAPGKQANQSPQLAKTAAAGSADTGDHSTTHLYGQSLRKYPNDCPPLNVQWYHAIDVAKRKTQWKIEAPEKGAAKQPAAPKKFSAFSASDSQALEAQYQKLLEVAEETGQMDTRICCTRDEPSESRKRKGSGAPPPSADSANVPVNEDYLFDVDIPRRELVPVYWLGPVYEVRRGTWFYQDGSQLKPCEENLAAQLEEGFLKLQPWLHQDRAKNLAEVEESVEKAFPKASKTIAETGSSVDSEAKVSATAPQPRSHRLFGTYMNSMATYQDATTAWLSSDTMLSWVTSSVYERFAGGGYMSGVKLIRGFSEATKSKDKGRSQGKESNASSAEAMPGLDTAQQKILKRRSAPTMVGSPDGEGEKASETSADMGSSPHATLQRQLSSLIEGDRRSTDSEEQIQQRQEQEMKDYHAQAGETQAREVDHLILVTHGIGQQLSLRMESVNFVHDVNTLRKSLKSVYASSADLKALNSELESSHGNCRVQVLPVCWRHLLNFPKQREKGAEHDLGDADGDEDAYPSLEDITVEGVAFARSLMSDLALDVLLYQSSYRSQISKIVLGECNRIHKLYKERNPAFNGKVHVMGHSLGSAILFDILCRQRDGSNATRLAAHKRPSHGRTGAAVPKQKDNDFRLDFDVDDFYCLGSPIGLFEMLEGRTIAARQPANIPLVSDPLKATLPDEALLQQPIGAAPTEGVTGDHDSTTSVASPKTGQLFNIFHPSDPISYRLEPLISPSMTSLKPQGLPYTKRGLLNTANQGLTGIGAKVGQSVSGLWSSLSAGIANNMLNRSLGLSNEEVARMTDQAQSAHQKQIPGDESIDSSREAIAGDSARAEKTDERKKQLADSAASGTQPTANGYNPTLIDDELETLFSQFQKRRTETAAVAAAAAAAAEDQSGRSSEEARKLRKMRTEEAKVRALNRNGRVDYSIQESVLDFNPINTIASHMGYWADVDVSHFVLSQLLSSKPQRKRATVSEGREVLKKKREGR